MILAIASLPIAHTFTAMERFAAVGFAIVLLLVCLFWTYGYIRRRSKKRY